MTKFQKTTIHLAFIFISIIVVGLIHHNIEKPKLFLTKQDTALNVNNFFLSVFAMGNKRLLADIIWVTTLLESEETHYKSKDLNSWIYLRFDSITNLDPNFLEAYQFGGQYLNIGKDDIKGSEAIFDKGLNIFPNNYELNLYSGFLQAFELQNYKKAIKNYSMILYHPKSPPFILSIINKLKYSDTGNLELTYSLVEESLKNARDDYIKSKLLVDLYSLRAMIDLECLNNHSESNCNKKDLDGNYYIKKGGNYTAPKDFKKYKLFTN